MVSPFPVFKRRKPLLNSDASNAETEPDADSFIRRYSDTAELDRPAFLIREAAAVQVEIELGHISEIQVQTWMDELAGAFEETDLIDRAATIRTQLFEFSRNAVGEDHIATLAHMENLAHDLYWLGEFDESAALLDHVVQARCHSLGNTDPVTLESRRDLLTALVGANEFDRAKLVGEELVQHYTSQYGSDDPRTVKAKQNLDTVNLWIDEQGQEDDPH